MRRLVEWCPWLTEEKVAEVKAVDFMHYSLCSMLKGTEYDTAGLFIMGDMNEFWHAKETDFTLECINVCIWKQTREEISIKLKKHYF